MESVQILNQFEIVVDTMFSWHYFWIGFIVGAVMGLIVASGIGMSESDIVSFFVSLAIFIPIFTICVGALFGGVLCREPSRYETHYEVSINEEVNMKEFMDRYEIVETRGSIYIVREKN